MHIHGYSFAVLAVGYPEYDNATGKITQPNGDVTCDSELLCVHPRWSVSRPNFDEVRHPVIKDTVSIPVRGYMVLRFRAWNPGYWLFHCHIDTHSVGGMTILLRVALDKYPPLPRGFPRCYDASYFHPESPTTASKKQSQQRKQQSRQDLQEPWPTSSKRNWWQ
jgi:Multicopper oxidase